MPMFLEPSATTRLRHNQSPVAFFLFKRPDTSAWVFTAINRGRPPRLFVVADGPRPDQLCEAEQCAAARAVVEAVDWDCDVKTSYSDSNMGPKRRVETR